MVNFRKIKNLITISLLLIFFANVILVIAGKSNTIYLALNAALVSIPLLFGLTIRNKRLAYAKKKMAEKTDVDFKLLENKVGHKIVAETIMSEFQGTLVEVDGAWIKIKDRGMGNKVHLLKSSMVTFIIIKQGEEKWKA